MRERLKRNPTPRQWEAALADSPRYQKQKARDKAAAILKSVTKGFRAKAGERGRIIFLAASPKKGKAERLPVRSKRQGVPVYVDRKGKVRPALEYKRAAQGAELQKVKPYRFDPAGALVVTKSGRKAKRVRAEKKLRAEYQPVTKPLDIKEVKPAGRKALWDLPQQVRLSHGGGFGEWDKLADAVGRAMAKAFGGALAEERQLYVHFRIVVETPEGEVQTWDERIPFRQSEYQELVNRGWYDSFVMKKCYAFFAEFLKAQDMVSKGSAERMLELNDGEDDPGEWLDASGRPWKYDVGKGKRRRMFDNQAEIKAMYFNLERINITSK